MARMVVMLAPALAVVLCLCSASALGESLPGRGNRVLIQANAGLRRAMLQAKDNTQQLKQEQEQEPQQEQQQQQQQQQGQLPEDEEEYQFIVERQPRVKMSPEEQDVAAREGSDEWQIPDLSSCPLRFLPNLCYNRRWVPQALPDPGKAVYATLCDYDTLSLEPGHELSRQCLALGASLLASVPTHGLVMLMSNTAVVEERYAAALTKLNVKVTRFKPLQLPEAAAASHTKSNHHRWLKSYHKLFMWTLPYDRVVYIDADSLVLQNLDFLFPMRHDSVAVDGFPHRAYIAFEPRTLPAHLADYKQENVLSTESFRRGYPIGGLVLLSPNNRTYEKFVKLLQNGVDENGHWRYESGDQQLLQWHANLQLLPPNIQAFLDICQQSKHPLVHFPLRRSFVAHYTWSYAKRKGPQLRYFAPTTQSRVCDNQWTSMYRYFDDMVTGNTTLDVSFLSLRPLNGSVAA